MNRLLAVVLIAGSLGLVAARASAADAKPPEDLSKPVTTVRVGAIQPIPFRDANQKAQARYREATAACKARPSSEQKECMRSAKADLQTAQRVAKAEHDAALRRR